MSNENIKIKICGLSRKEDIAYVNECIPDYIGFVFAKSKRQVDMKKAAELKQYLHPSILSVGVFVNEPIENVMELCREKIIDVVQLHGDEPEEYARKLQENIDNSIIRAVRVESKKQVEDYNTYPCHYFLFDSYKQGVYGGTGQTFPKELIMGVDKPFFLAGGISSKNVIEELAGVSPYCVDVSSSVETDGRKDREKIRQFIQMVRSM